MEFLLADALNKKCDTIFTCGGVQSNHCRATAVAARQLGLDCYLFLRSSEQVSYIVYFLAMYKNDHLFTSHLNLMPLMFGPTVTLAHIFTAVGTRKTFLEQGLRTNNKLIQCNVCFHFHNIQTWGTLIIVWMCMPALH